MIYGHTQKGFVKDWHVFRGVFGRGVTQAYGTHAFVVLAIHVPRTVTLEG